jgi:hypothetical protein
MLTLGVALPTQAAFIINGGSAQDLPIVDNKFNTELTGLGFDRMFSSADLRVSQDGFIDFYYIGAESGFNNTFTAQDSAASGNAPGVLSEHNEGFNFAGYSSFSIAVKADEAVNFHFSSDDATALTPVDNFTGSHLEGLGIYINSTQQGSLLQVLLGYDDQTVNDDNDFEDMLIRADFRPKLSGSGNGGSVVPLPAAVWLFGSGLVGLAGFSRRTGRLTARRS